eukprot:Gb_03190 [translate_table: standard]
MSLFWNHDLNASRIPQWWLASSPHEIFSVLGVCHAFLLQTKSLPHISTLVELQPMFCVMYLYSRQHLCASRLPPSFAPIGSHVTFRQATTLHLPIPATWCGSYLVHLFYSSPSITLPCCGTSTHVELLSSAALFNTRTHTILKSLLLVSSHGGQV